MAVNIVEIYTDGACRGNPGPGGWGASLRYKGEQKDLYGAERETTNNRMELMAAIQGLEALTRPCAAKVYTDSKYVVEGITKWLPGWKQRGWKTASKQPVKNVELWQRLDKIASHVGHRMIPHDGAGLSSSGLKTGEDGEPVGSKFRYTIRF